MAKTLEPDRCARFFTELVFAGAGSAAAGAAAGSALFSDAFLLFFFFSFTSSDYTGQVGVSRKAHFEVETYHDKLSLNWLKPRQIKATQQKIQLITNDSGECLNRPGGEVRS